MRHWTGVSKVSRAIIVLFILISFVLAVTSCAIPAAAPSPQAVPSSPVPNSSPSPALPLPPTPSTAPIREVTQSAEQILRRYAWEYGDRDWTLELTVPQALYDYYKEIPRPPTQNYSVYVTHPMDDGYLSDLVGELRMMARGEDFSDLQSMEFAAAFVQSLPYTDDSVTTPYDEYPRYPIESLVDKGGDCEDTSILTASLLTSLGYEVVLILFPDEHCAVGVPAGEGTYGVYFTQNGKNYFYLETTNTGWRIGQIPNELKEVTAHIYDITPTPILMHEWHATIRGNIAELEITVENLGTQSADDVYILAGFDAGESKLWNSEESQTFDLPVDQSISISLTLQAPLGKHTRLVLQIIHDGYAVDESYSEWFDT